MTVLAFSYRTKVEKKNLKRKSAPNQEKNNKWKIEECDKKSVLGLRIAA